MRIERFFRDVRHALRQIRRAPALSLAAAGTLAVAIGAGATIASLLNAIVLRTLPVRDGGRLAAISLKDPRGGSDRLIPYDTYALFASEQRVFESMFAYSGGGLIPLEARGALVDGGIASVTPEFATTLGVKPFLGRLIEPQDAPEGGEPARVVVLGYAMWQRLFGGDTTAVGDRLVVDGAPLTIIGVMPAGFKGLHVDGGSDFYVPLTLLGRIAGRPVRSARAYNIVGRLRDGVTLQQARASITAAWPALQAATLPGGLNAAQQEEVKAQRVYVESAASGFSSLRRQYATPLFFLTGLAGVLLLIGCANLSGLLLNRVLARQHQFAICLALGASRLQIARPLILEAVFLSLAGTLTAVPIAWAASRTLGSVLWSTATAPLSMSMAPDVRVIAAMGAVALLAGLAIGILPALIAGANEPQRTLRARTTTRSTARWGRLLLTAQVALSFILLFGAALFAGSVGHLRRIDGGFRPEGIVFTRAWQLPGPRRAYDEQTYYPALVERLSAIPGVRSAALSHYFPAYLNFRSLTRHPIARVEERERAFEAEGLMEFISPRFFETVGATVVRGRDFTWADRAGSPAVAIINAALERRLFPGGTAIGQRVRIGADPRRQSLEVVGVVSDVTVGDLRSPHLPVAFRPRMQEPQYMRVPIVTLHVSGDAGAVAAAVGPAIRSLGQEYIRGTSTLTEQLDVALLEERLLAGVSSFFAGQALVLALVGLYALLSQALVRRTREIGLRMAVGASRRSVVALVVREGLALTILGVAIGMAGALPAGRLAGSLLHGMQPSDPWMLSITAALFVVMAAAATLPPALRASAIDPTVALRSE